MYEKTYSDHNYENFWSSILVTCELFQILAKEVAEHLMFTYPMDDDQRMTEFLKHVRKLPADAQGIY
jgi:aminoglycoside 6-adenylyltransferase